MHAFIMHHYRNAKARLLNEVSLNGIILFGTLSGGISLVGQLGVRPQIFVGPDHFAQPMRKILLCQFCIELTARKHHFLVVAPHTL